MAVGSSFKQVCPSCEALVPVKDKSLVGKKIDCPKCKYRFVVEDPVKKDKEAVKAQKGGKTSEEDEDLVDEEVEEAPAKSKNGKTTTKGKAPTKRFRDDEDAKKKEPEAPADGKDKKKKKEKKPGGESKKKLTLGLALAAIGLIVLGAAAFFILNKPSSPPPRPSPPPSVAKIVPPPMPEPEQTDNEPKKDGEKSEEKKDEEKKDEEKKDVPVVPVVNPLIPDFPVVAAGPELTNLLPNDTEHVFHAYLGNLLDTQGLVSGPAFRGLGSFNDDELRARFGFSLLALDDLIRAERYTIPAWSYTVLHSLEPFNLKALEGPLGLKPAAKPIKSQTYYQVTKANPWFEGLARTAFGVPALMRNLPIKRDPRPTFLYLHNPQTLIVADEAPLMAFLEKEGHFPIQKETTPDAPKPAVKEVPKEGDNPDEAKPPPAPTPAAPMPVLSGTYLTVKPRLKAVLERMEFKPAESTQRVLFSSATELDAARADVRLPEYRDKLYWHPRQVWDVTLLLREKTPRLHLLGAGLVQKDTRTFQFKNELACGTDTEARDLHKDVNDKVGPPILRFFDQVLSHPVEFVRADAPPPMPEVPKSVDNVDAQPAPVVMKKDDVQQSRLTIARNGAQVDVKLDLLLDQVAYGRIYALSELLMSGLKGEIDLGAYALARRHPLAQGGKLLGERGLPDREVAPGTWPPGAFPRPPASSRAAREPQNRISWLAGLLPFLGQETLFQKLHFEQNWKDPVNWIAARSLVPQFQDPNYPAGSRFASQPELGFELGATHFVGIAGVGLDAADYPAGDPTYVAKRGVLGYNRSATLAEVQAGHGLSNTALMVQVPHDGSIGVTPWIAGGGATSRGVPEKNSIAPFVLSTDRFGKPIEHQGKRGTFVLMTDGSVRFVDQNVADDVFKAMCTVQGPLPEGFDLDKNEWTPMVPAPKEEDPPPVKLTPKKELPPPVVAKVEPPKVVPMPPPMPKKEAPPMPKVVDDQPAVGAVELVKEYQKSKAAAEKKYNGKTFVIQGKLERGRRGQEFYLETGLRSILPDSDDDVTDVVILRTKDRAALREIPAGTVVWIRGRCTGFREDFDVVFEDCELVRR